MSFLPSTYEKVPKAPSNYMSFEEGTNRFRILSSAIVGYSYWNTQTKPVRSREKWATLPADIKPDRFGNIRINHFWAFVVWNYQENLVQILEVTQATIQRAMKIKIDNRNGDAKGYDFIITRTDGDPVDYDVDVAEASPLAPEIEAAYKAKPVNLEALYDGADPFAIQPSQPTQPKEELPVIQVQQEPSVDDIPFG